MLHINHKFKHRLIAAVVVAAFCVTATPTPSFALAPSSRVAEVNKHELSYGIAEPWDEAYAKELSRRIATQLGLKDQDLAKLYRDLHVMYGMARYDVEQWGIYVEGRLDRLGLIRIGYLFFIDEDLYQSLSQPDRRALGANVIRIKKREYVNIFTLNRGYRTYNLAMIAAMFHTDFKNKRVIDAGAGDGILSIVAHKLGATKFDLIEKDGGWPEESRAQLSLNGLKEGEDFRLHALDITNPAQVAQHIQKTDQEIVILSNIGNWHYSATNQDSIRLINWVSNVVAFIGGGYRGYIDPYYESGPDRHLITQLGFPDDLIEITATETALYRLCTAWVARARLASKASFDAHLCLAANP